MKSPISISRGEIRNEWRALLKDLKIENCRKIVQGDIGEPFKTKSTSGSEVYRFEHPEGRAVYVKRYDGLSAMQAVKRILKFRWPHSNAFYEYRMAEILRDLGFKVMEPMAWAEDCAVGVVPLRGGGGIW